MDRYTPFECDVKSIVNNIKDGIQTRRVTGVRSLLHMAKDSTKIAKYAQFNIKFKCIIGLKWECHMIPTDTLSKYDTDAILTQHSNSPHTS